MADVTVLPKPWLDSNTVRSLLFSMAFVLLGWATIGLTTGAWDWQMLGVSELGILTPFVKRLADPDVIAPFAFLNARNPRP